MSESPVAAGPRGEWWTRPRIVLPAVAALVVLVALLTPQATGGRTGDQRLSTHLSGALGAKLLHDAAGRLGWRVVRRDDQAMPGAATGTTIHAVLAPPLEVTPEEAHAYLEAVRSGDALLLVLDRRGAGQRDALADSLGVSPSRGGGTLEVPAADTVGCPAPSRFVPPLWADGKVHLWSLRWARGAPPARTVFAITRPEVDLTGAERAEPLAEAAVGFPLGRGRVAVVSDPDLLRNDAIRRCDWGTDLRTVRILEYLRAGGSTPRTTLAFDEYHHGYGNRVSMTGTTRRFLVRHPVGRTLLQIALAGLVLLLATAPRALPPTDVIRVERRDPLEQIDALAHAYEQVRATRTLAARLLHGVRSRVERGWSSSRARPNEEFLADAVHQVPSLAADVELVRRALAGPIPERSLPELGAALRRIEHSLTPSAHA
jgi:hypothetical protein